ncbi:Zn finger domain containing protein [Halorhabdus sp. SVX81]|uniref:HEWD family protein n=1 Tax=Halorhabdus sp. SVX81 TaxID=2978283 RepID=UPI0023DBBC41|nr:HEWD family protein [Halorhabdus sp. SVX81]WEL17928.1 Zn finger domain containing protein [Halorhabdus sp. SVX81]
MIRIAPPNERKCERCGRKEVWDDDRGVWAARDDDWTGSPHCLHEWDINGSYNPIEEL